jgi:DNA-binding winged helix-turn-helix (wHTH) protein/tetratricopeptide (TPR) repeat protein
MVVFMAPNLIRSVPADNESPLKSGLLLYDRVQVTDPTTFRFDGWLLQPRSGELVRDGNVQRLPQQPLRMLVELLGHPGEVVTRERLVQVLWPKGIVDFDNSLNAVVRKLRVVLGDDSETPRYIETLPRIGYRFVGKIEPAAAVESAAAPESPASSSQPSARPNIAALVAVFIAIFGGGVAIFASRKHPDVALAPAAAAPNNSAYPRRTTNERAYDAYLQGIFNRSRRDINGTDLAVANFETALKEDPYYADAYAGLSETLSGAAMSQYMPTVAAYDRAKAAALRAIELDEKLGHGHAALAHIAMMYEHDFAKAERETDLARRLDPNYSRNWHTLALLRAFQGRLPEALDAIRRARELEPMTLLYNSNYGLLLYNARRYDEAIAHARSLISSQPRLDQTRTMLIRALVAKGDVKAALEQLPLRVNEKPNLADAGFVYAHAGRRADALGEITRIERLGKTGDYGVGYDVAIIQAALGNLPAACAALERALDDHSLVLPWMRTDPRMDPLRGRQCFADVERKLYR